MIPGIGIVSFNGKKPGLDGKYMIVGHSNIGVYLSSDYGLTWTQTNAPTGIDYRGLAISQDGKYCWAATRTNYLGGYLYRSDDYGVTWTEWTDLGYRPWTDIKISRDGKHVICCAHPSYVIHSFNFGIDSWGFQHSSQYYNSVAVSADGMHLMAAYGTNVWKSINSGSTWSNTWGNTESMTGLCMSDDAVYRIICPTSGTGFIFSKNTAASWGWRLFSSPNHSAISGDGKYCLVGGGGALLSSDYMSNWVNNSVNNYGTGPFAMSYSGKYVLTANDYGIRLSSNYGSTYIQVSTLNCGYGGAAVAVSRFKD